MPITPRDITQGRQDQGSGETVVYTLTTTRWGSSPTSPSVTVYDVTAGAETDVTTTVATGSASVSGDVITFPSIASLTAEKIYRCDVTFTTGSNTLTVSVYIHCNAFTYLGDLSSNRDRVRLYLADTDPGGGPLPSDRNFSDNEIDGLITIEGSWQRAVAGGFEALASAWRRYPSHTADGLQFSGSDIAKGYAESAREWRTRYGGSTSSVGVRHPTRVDGYSDDVASDTA
jgi:hypothetical protein